VDILGWHIIPRRNVEVAALESGSQLAYVRPVLAEYEQILGAIKAKNARRARSAARRHLAKGREHYLR
jgi:DNA-binding FadR family transcriptional regulator